MSETVGVLRTAAAVGLPGAALPVAGPDATLTADAIASAANQAIEGLVWRAVESGAVSADGEVTDRARTAYLTALRRSLLAEETAVLALAALAAARVEARVLKGVAIAHLDHTDPAERIFGDADVLVHRRDHGRAIAALVEAGFSRRMPPVRRWWERRFAKAVLMDAPNGGELDLHLTITPGFFGERISEDDLWATASEPFPLGGRTAVALSAENRLLHACCHKVLGGASGLRVTRDVAQLVLLGRADWRHTVDAACHDGADLVVAEAGRSTWAELRLDPTHPFAQWAADHRADVAQQRALDGYHAQGRSGWGPEGRAMIAALGPLDRVRFLAGLAVPSRASLRARGRTWREHLRLGRSTMRGGR
jgi:hypothetical protein